MGLPKNASICPTSNHNFKLQKWSIQHIGKDQLRQTQAKEENYEYINVLIFIKLPNFSWVGCAELVFTSILSMWWANMSTPKQPSIIDGVMDNFALLVLSQIQPLSGRNYIFIAFLLVCIQSRLCGRWITSMI